MNERTVHTVPPGAVPRLWFPAVGDPLCCVQVCANIMEYCQTLLLQSSAQAQFTVCLFSPSASEPAGRDAARPGGSQRRSHTLYIFTSTVFYDQDINHVMVLGQQWKLYIFISAVKRFNYLIVFLMLLSTWKSGSTHTLCKYFYLKQHWPIL